MLFSLPFRRFLSGTMLSRITGLVRDISMAVVYGDHPAIAAFLIAFRFSHLLRRLFGERALQATFLPHYEELRGRQENPSAFVIQMFWSMLLVVGGITLLGIGALAYWQPPDWMLFAAVLPSLLFVCLYALNSACLQAHDAFFVSSVAPACCNLIWIAAVWIGRSYYIDDAVFGLALSVSLGMFFQWLITLPALWKHLDVLAWWREKRFFVQHWQKLGKTTLYTLVAVGVLQINTFLDTLFAEWSSSEGPVYLWYAMRIQQLPLALLGIGAVTTLTPIITRALQQGNGQLWRENERIVGHRLSLLVILMGGMWATGYWGLNLMYGYGAFSEHAVLETAYALWAYSLGLFPAALALYYAALFYAINNYTLPMWISVGSVLLNIALNSWFVFGCSFGPLSIALATSIVSWINAWALWKMWKRQIAPQSCASFFLQPVREHLYSWLAVLGGWLGTMGIEWGVLQGMPTIEWTFLAKLVAFVVSGTLFCMVTLVLWRVFNLMPFWRGQKLNPVTLSKKDEHPYG